MDIFLLRLRSSLSAANDDALADGSARFLDEVAMGDINFVPNRVSEAAPTVFFLESGGTEAPFLRLYEGFPEPYYLLPSGKANSLASALEILSFLRQKGLRGEIIQGDISAIHGRLSAIAKTQKAKALLGCSRLAIIGEPSDWLIASAVDFALAKAVFGIQFMKIPFSEFLREIDDSGSGSTSLPSGLLGQRPEEETLKGAMAIHEALQKIARRHSLTGFSVRCFDLLGTKKNTACLALALLNSEGFAAGCEGDEASLVSMEIIRVLGFPSFQCNPYAIDIGGRNISLAHCSVPFSMVESYSLMTHYESGLGIGVRGKFAEGEKVTLFKMAPDLRSYHLFVGTLLRNDERADACRTQIEVRLDNPPTDLLAHPYGNHLLLARGDMSESLSLLLSGYGILQAKTDI